MGRIMHQILHQLCLMMHAGLNTFKQVNTRKNDR
jgi:hypothetical protein